MTITDILRTLLRFRYEPKDGRFVLIGQDVVDTDRLTGEAEPRFEHLTD